MENVINKRYSLPTQNACEFALRLLQMDLTGARHDLCIVQNSRSMRRCPPNAAFMRRLGLSGRSGGWFSTSEFSTFYRNGGGHICSTTTHLVKSLHRLRPAIDLCPCRRRCTCPRRADAPPPCRLGGPARRRGGVGCLHHTPEHSLVTPCARPAAPPDSTLRAAEPPTLPAQKLSLQPATALSIAQRSRTC